MTRLELRVVVAAVLAATVVLRCRGVRRLRADHVASAMSIYALGVGAWLYHAIRTPDLGTPHQHCSHGSKAVAPTATSDRHHGPDASRGTLALGDVTVRRYAAELSQLPVALAPGIGLSADRGRH